MSNVELYYLFKMLTSVTTPVQVPKRGTVQGWKNLGFRKSFRFLGLGFGGFILSIVHDA